MKPAGAACENKSSSLFDIKMVDGQDTGIYSRLLPGVHC